jgi:hypothetical protein
MTVRSGIEKLTGAEIEDLFEPGRTPLRNRVVTCLTLLYDLITRYTGSMRLVNFPEEEVAQKVLHRNIEAIRGSNPYWQRMAQNVAAYWRIRELSVSHPASPMVFELAQAMCDDLEEMYTGITQYPRLLRATAALKPPPAKRKRATG